MAWVPVIVELQGGQLYIFIQEVSGYLTPPIAALFLLGVLWKRGNEAGAFWGGMVGFALGFSRLVLAFVYQEPPCDRPDDRPALLSGVHYMYVAAGLFWLSGLVAVLVSLCTPPPGEEQVCNTTLWGLRRKGQQPITVREEEIHMLSSKSGTRKAPPSGCAGPAHISLLVPPTENPAPAEHQGNGHDHLHGRDSENGAERERERGKCLQAVDWFCGYKEASRVASPTETLPNSSQEEENRRLVLEMLFELPQTRLLLNLGLLVMCCLGVFMFVFFSL